MSFKEFGKTILIENITIIIELFALVKKKHDILN